MARFFKRRDESLGLPPGHLVFIGEKKVDALHMRLIDYHATRLREEDIQDIEVVGHALASDAVSWINVNGLHDTDTIRKVGATFELHPLLLEDLRNTGQRPKLEEFEDTLFIVLKMLWYDKDEEIVVSEQLRLVLGHRFLLNPQTGDFVRANAERGPRTAHHGESDAETAR